MVDVLVLGATGFTGKLITRYLHVHRERDSFTFAIGGRSKTKLGELVADLNLAGDVQVFEVDVTKADQVDEVVRKAKVVINTIGPFFMWGKPVVRACARNGVHYVDITGETTYVQDLIKQYDFLAHKSRAIIVPSCGFDSIPADISAYLAAKTLRSSSSGALSIVDSHGLYRLRGGISGGTASTMINSIETIPLKKLREARRAYSLSPVKGLPVSGEKLVHTLPYVKKGKYGFASPLAGHNIATVQRTWGLFQLHASSDSDRESDIFPYGDAFKYNEGILAPGFLSAGLVSLTFAITSVCLLFLPPARWLLKMMLPKSGQGPSDDKLESGFFKLRNISVSSPSPETKKPVIVETVVSGKGDPGYTLTAIMVSESALCLLNRSKLTSLAQEGGILTPMSAFGDTLIKRLKASGRFEFESEVLEDA